MTNEPLQADNPRPPEGLRTSRRVWLPIVLVLVLLGIPLMTYGTLSPCGMFKQEIRSQLMREYLLKPGGKSKWESAGEMLGVGLAGVVIDRMVGALSPMECLDGLVRLKLEGKSIFSSSFQSSHRRRDLTGGSKPSWNLTTKRSPIDDSKNVYISLEANNSIKGWIKEETPSLWLRCKENKTTAFIVTGMSPKSEYGHNTVPVTLRFDKERAFEQRFSKSTDGEALFARNPFNFIRKMLKHKTMLFQFTPYNASPAMTTFNLAGLDKKIGELQRACHWKISRRR